ncbi:MAG: hypothetical protein BWY77_01170 [bacterium ADurb.Bin431]|nr:MAG: hypothetical protein BWY77_01170 [bacterium ADurb.Bin431]
MPHGIVQKTPVGLDLGVEGIGEQGAVIVPAPQGGEGEAGSREERIEPPLPCALPSTALDRQALQKAHDSCLPLLPAWPHAEGQGQDEKHPLRPGDEQGGAHQSGAARLFLYKKPDQQEQLQGVKKRLQSRDSVIDKSGAGGEPGPEEQDDRPGGAEMAAEQQHGQEEGAEAAARADELGGRFCVPSHGDGW